MKTSELNNNKLRGEMTLRPWIAFLAVIFLMSSNLSPAQKPSGEAGQKSPVEIKKAYDVYEAALLARLQDRAKLKLKPEEIEETIDALGHIRSKKAVPLLLQMLEFDPEVTGDPRQLVLGGGKRMLPDGCHPSLRALAAIGSFSMADILQEIERSDRGSNREGLLVYLGWKLYRTDFVKHVKGLAADKSRKDNVLWQKVFDQHVRGYDDYQTRLEKEKQERDKQK